MAISTVATLTTWDRTNTDSVEARLLAKPPRKSAAPYNTADVRARRMATDVGEGAAPNLAGRARH